eukprot:1155964-Pelagomonas_calceolata.AAC.4
MSQYAQSAGLLLSYVAYAFDKENSQLCSCPWLPNYPTTHFESAQPHEYNYIRHGADWTGLGQCGGNAQSPIDIVTTELVDPSEEGVERGVSGASFNDLPTATLTDVKVNLEQDMKFSFAVPSDISLPTITIGEVEHKFTPLQVHFHHFASEHTVDGMEYPLEAHVVMQSDQDENQLAVLGILYKYGEEDPFLKKLTDAALTAINQGRHECLTAFLLTRHTFAIHADHARLCLLAVLAVLQWACEERVRSCRTILARSRIVFSSDVPASAVLSANFRHLWFPGRLKRESNYTCSLTLNGFPLCTGDASYGSKEVPLDVTINVREDLLPSKSLDYYGYDGSLTTPSCDEIVKWHVFTTPRTLSVEQEKVGRGKGVDLVNTCKCLDLHPRHTYE